MYTTLSARCEMSPVSVTLNERTQLRIHVYNTTITFLLPTCDMSGSLSIYCYWSVKMSDLGELDTFQCSEMSLVEELVASVKKY